MLNLRTPGFTHMLLRSVLALLLTTALPAHAAQFTDSFDDGLDPGDFSLSAPAGFEADVVTGKVVMTKAEGTGNGYAHLSTTFTLKGDFDITILADRTLATAGSVMGLLTSHLTEAGGFTDVYFSGTGNLVSNIFVAHVHDQVVTAASASFVVFRIRRIGSQLIHEVDSGGGYVQINDHTDDVLAGPVQLSLFIGEESGSTNAATATYDDLVVTAAVISPPCGNGVLEDGEACDDDDPSWITGQSCNASCELLLCGDADDSGEISASDALHALRTSVAVRECDACVCDTDSSGGDLPTSVSDALRLLRVSVGQPLDLNCPPCA